MSQSIQQASRRTMTAPGKMKMVTASGSVRSQEPSGKALRAASRMASFQAAFEAPEP